MSTQSKKAQEQAAIRAQLSKDIKAGSLSEEITRLGQEAMISYLTCGGSADLQTSVLLNSKRILEQSNNKLAIRLFRLPKGPVRQHNIEEDHSDMPQPSTSERLS